MSNKAFIHISGPFGVGKTTLRSKLRKAFPNIWFIELDNYEKEVRKALDLPEKWRRSNGWEKHKEPVRKVRRDALARDLSQAERDGKVVVLTGNPFEGDDQIEYNIDAKHKFVLVRPLDDIARDRLNRDNPEVAEGTPRHEELINHHKAQTAKHMKFHIDYGYEPITPEDAEIEVSKLLEGRDYRIAKRLIGM
jgi:hypothetical protein